jgi:uncharacterized membrane protein YhfC
MNIDEENMTQVPTLSVVFMALSAIMAVGTPIALFVILYKKYKLPIAPVIIGSAAFILFVLILERAIHFIVLGRFNLREKPFIYMLYGVLMAGLFEETARFISFNVMKRKYHKIGAGLSYGIGHGGIEAIIIVGIAMINNMVLSFMINAGTIENIAKDLTGETLIQMNAQITALVTTAPYLFLISGIERLFTLIVQIALSIIVFYGVFCRNKWWLYPLAIIIHAIIDVPAVLMQTGILKNIVFVEVLAGISALLLLFGARYIHKTSRETLIYS